MLHIEKNPGVLFEINALTNSARILLTRILSLVLLDHLTPIINPVGKRIEFVMSDLKNSAILLELFQNDEKKLLQWLEHIRTSLAVDMLVGKDVPTSLFNDRTIEKLSMSLIPINEVSTEKPSLGFDVMMAGEDDLETLLLDELTAKFRQDYKKVAQSCKGLENDPAYEATVRQELAFLWPHGLKGAPVTSTSVDTQS